MEKDNELYPFKTYERIKIETKKVAEVTEENIVDIARLSKGQIDYSGDLPELIITQNSGHTWRVKVGWHVSLSGNLLVNQNGFNIDGDWQEVSS